MPTTKIAMMRITVAENIAFLLVRLIASETSGRLDDQNKTVASDNFDAGPWLQRCFGPRTPDLSLDANTSFLSIPRYRLRLGTKQCLLASNYGSPMRLQQHRKDKQEESGGHSDRTGNNRGGQPEPRHPGGKHHERANRECDDAANSDGP